MEKAREYNIEASVAQFPERGDADSEKKFETCFIGNKQILTRKGVLDQHRYLSNRDHDYL